MDDPKLQDDFAKLSADLATLRGDVSKLTDTLAALVRNEGEAVSAAVKQQVKRGAAKAEATAAGLLEEGSAAVDEAKARAQSLASDVGTAIERNPFGAVIAALGVGFVFGLLTRGRD
ncbi:hypothetical protein [Ancylobacter terrae]|uniref:hypothetical protein n=1 Tax=Ancylobacter sp. sgz301288 TaxID=3342077 RepID=UPI00385EED5D